MCLLNCSELFAHVYFTLAAREIEFRFAVIVNSKLFQHESFSINSEKFRRKTHDSETSFHPISHLGGGVLDFLYKGVCPPQKKFNLLQNFPLKTIPCPRISHTRYKITRRRSPWNKRNQCQNLEEMDPLELSLVVSLELQMALENDVEKSQQVGTLTSISLRARVKYKRANNSLQFKKHQRSTLGPFRRGFQLKLV